jgi:hypothetical protein
MVAGTMVMVAGLLHNLSCWNKSLNQQHSLVAELVVQRLETTGSVASRKERKKGS